MTGPVTTEALAEALAYLKPHETNGGTISLKAPKAREAVAVIEAALQQVTAERDEARAENDRFRAGLANSNAPCAYCDLSREDWSKCRSGFPGCDRADDAMLCPHFGAEMEANDRADAATSELARLRAEGEAKDRRIALADRVKAQLEVAQNALCKIDRGGKPMRDIAAQALLDIAMVPYPEETPALARAATAREG